MNGLLGVDVYEGSGNLDEQVLLDAGVKFMIIRINDMAGGHHPDANFKNQWDRARNFVRWPYFVYNPWVNQTENFKYLSSVMPAEAKHVSMDIEVAMPGYSPAEYARQVSGFINTCCDKWCVDIYTGAWFLPNLTTWPKNVNYWWARYPGTLFSKPARTTTWSDVKSIIAAETWNPGVTPGPCVLWQCSGDSLKLEGTNNRAMDISVFKGTIDELNSYAGMPAQPVVTIPAPVPVVIPTIEDRISELEKEEKELAAEVAVLAAAKNPA